VNPQQTYTVNISPTNKARLLIRVFGMADDDWEGDEGAAVDVPVPAETEEADVGEVTVVGPDPVRGPVVDRSVAESVPVVAVDVTFPVFVCVPVELRLVRGSVGVTEVKMDPPMGWLDVSVAAVEDWDVVGNEDVVIGGLGWICADVKQREASTKR